MRRWDGRGASAFAGLTTLAGNDAVANITPPFGVALTNDGGGYTGKTP